MTLHTEHSGTLKMSFKMNKRLYLAPVKGITDRTFRRVFAASFNGIDAAVAPFITASDTDKKLKDLKSSADDKFRTIPQILAKSEEQFITLAQKLSDDGSDEINWNLGCPFKKVLDKGEGAALLKSPDAIEKFLDTICSASLPPISVKMRLGFNDPGEICPVIERLNKYPLKKIIIHPRTAAQMYEGNINITAFLDALRQSVHKVVYNGDIIHFTDINYLYEQTGELHGWMIGRGLLINPLLAEEINSGKIAVPDEKIKRIKQFVDTLFNEYQSELQSSAHVLDKMHGVWNYLSQNFHNGKKIEKKIRKTLSIKHYADEVKRIFESGVNILNNHSILFHDNPRHN